MVVAIGLGIGGHFIGLYELPFLPTTNEPIEWQNAEIEQTIRTYLGKHAEDIYPSDLDGITALFFDGNDASVNEAPPVRNEGADLIKTLVDLAHFNELTSLALKNQELDSIKDLPPIETLTELDVSGNNITDVTPITNMENIKDLDVSDNNITDISPLGNVKTLESLDISNNNIEDITPLNGLENLKEFNAENNDIEDPSPLAGLENLEDLDIGGNPITDDSLFDDIDSYEPPRMSQTVMFETEVEGAPGDTLGVTNSSELIPVSRAEFKDFLRYQNSIDTSPVLYNTGFEDNKELTQQRFKEMFSHEGLELDTYTLSPFNGSLTNLYNYWTDNENLMELMDNSSSIANDQEALEEAENFKYGRIFSGHEMELSLDIITNFYGDQESWEQQILVNFDSEQGPSVNSIHTRWNLTSVETEFENVLIDNNAVADNQILINYEECTIIMNEITSTGGSARSLYLEFAVNNTGGFDIDGLFVFMGLNSGSRRYDLVSLTSGE